MSQAGAAHEVEALDKEVTHGRAFQIRHHVSRRSIQNQRSPSLSREVPDQSSHNGTSKEVEARASTGNQGGDAVSSSAGKGTGRD